MSGELASLNDCLARVGVAGDSDAAADALVLLRAISAEVRTRTRRAYEGTATIYEQAIDTGGSNIIILPHVPVADVLHVATEDWDGTRNAIDVPEPGDYRTTLAADVAVGATNMKVASVDGVAVGDHLSISTDEVVRVTAVGAAGALGTGIDFEPAATFANAAGLQVYESTGSTYWRLVDARRGRLERFYGFLGPRAWDEDAERFARTPTSGRRFVVVRWRVSGAVDYATRQAVIDWFAARWSERDRAPGQTSYTTGDDSEDWDASLAGSPPPSAARVFATAWHPSRNGVV